MDQISKNPAHGQCGRADNVIFSDNSNANINSNYYDAKQGLKPTSPLKKPNYWWARVCQYRDIYEREQSALSLMAYERALSDFSVVFCGGAS